LAEAPVRPHRARSGRAPLALAASIAVCTLVVTGLVAAGAWEIGVEGEWTWRYHERPAAWSSVMPAAAIVLLAMGLYVFALRKGSYTRREQTILVVVLMLLSLAFQVGTGLLSPLGVADCVPVNVKPWTGGYYLESLLIGRDTVEHSQGGVLRLAPEYSGLGAYLAGYDAHIARMQVDNWYLGHIADHPPGIALVNLAVVRMAAALPRVSARVALVDGETRAVLRRRAQQWTVAPVKDAKFLLDPSAREDQGRLSEALIRVRISDEQFLALWQIGFLYQIAAALVVIPAYVLARSMYSLRAAVLAAALAGAIPSLHLFGPFADQLFPVLALSCYGAAHTALERRSAGWAAAAGAGLFLALQFTLAFVAVIALIGLNLLLRLAVGDERPRNRAQARRWAVLLGSGLAGLVVPALLAFLFFNYDSFAVWAICLEKHASFALRFPRTYWKWTLFSPLEFAVFMGVPVSVLLVWGFVRGALDAARRMAGPRRAELLPGAPRAAAAIGDPAFLLSAFLLTMAVLILLGKNLGEVGRLWMFLMPFGAVAAAGVLEPLTRRKEWVTACVLALQIGQAVCFKRYLNVFFE